MADRLELLLSLLKEKPADDFLLFALGKEYESRGQLELSLDYYRQLCHTNPNYVGVYYHLGKLLEQLGQTPEALNAYSNGMSVAKQLDDKHAWSELSGAKLNLEMEE